MVTTTLALSILALSATTNVAAVAIEKRQNPDLIQALNAANTPNERYKLLGKEGLVFDYLDAPSFGGGGKDGGVVLADNTVFPGVIGQGQAMLMGFLGPCGMVAPHIHPRASEYLLNVAGPPLLATVIPENGADPISVELGAGNVTILPAGSVHMVAGTGCQPTLIVASFNAESPGVLLFSTAYQAFDTETLDAAFGGVGATVYDSSKIPANIMIGRDECLKKCGINRATFDISQMTKRELMKQALQGYLDNY
jgi:oxalate decarboxylase/phosphoglucose isomerase-like protein (cupin superfamily)